MTKHPLPTKGYNTSWPQRLKTVLAVVLTPTLMSGCASVYLVDNQVQSFARWTDATTVDVPQVPQTYRFERLPSQSTGPDAAGQDALENLARQTLAQVGWSVHGTPAAAPWTVQVSASTLRLPRAPWEDPWDSHWGGLGFPGRGHAVTASGHLIGSPVFMRMDMPYYKREVSLVVRHAASGRVVYESRAAHDGRWNSTPGLWSAMLEAALRDFPIPPNGVRQILIEVAR